MYAALLFFHSLFRWFVLMLLLYSIYRAFDGYSKNRSFSTVDNAVRHWTATVAHLQLMIGIILYTRSPVVGYFWAASNNTVQFFDAVFFSVVHLVLMISAIVVLTIGSALAKRKATDSEKFRTMLIWFSVSLLMILMAIPWPFSPLSARPYYRTM